MSYDLQAEGDNGVRDRTRIAALEGFRDRVQPESSVDPADPRFSAVLVVMGGDDEGNSIPENGSIIGVRGIGGAAPGVVGKGGAAGGSPGVVGIGGAERGTGIMGITDNVTYPGNVQQLGVCGLADGSNSIAISGENRSGHAIVGFGGGRGAGVVGLNTSGAPPATVPPTGVFGEAQGHSSVGVHGIGERGGVFESPNLAQVQLVPHGIDTPAGKLEGKPGDLVTTRVSHELKSPCKLWFCVLGGTAASAVWKQIA
jgi:hypothetical protein